VSDCAICARPADSVPDGRADGDVFKCARCGTYRITRTASVILRHDHRGPDSLMPYLSAFTRQRFEAGDPALIRSDNWEAAARRHQTPISQKLLLLLKHLQRRSKHLGDRIEINSALDCALFDCRPEDVRFLLTALEESEAIRKDRDKDRWTITAKGFDRLYPTTSGGVPGTCFVAMAFADEVQPAYDDGIELAVREDCGLRPVRLDREEHNELVNDRMMAEIRGCQFLVADVTLHRTGVYFEAGFAMGLGHTVIWCCREDQMPEAHFDTRQYPHIIWKTPQELREKLRNRIRATVAIPARPSAEGKDTA
jgi:hypothetical protein